MKSEIKIQRPDGQIDIIDVTSKFPMVSVSIIREMREKTRAAGRGEVICGLIDGVEVDENASQIAASGGNVYAHSFTSEVRRAGDINRFNVR